jgi:hypothetical protein
MSDIDFSERMRRVPDEELISILSSDGFVPEAVEAARAELERRNLNPGDLVRMSAQVEEARHEEEGKAELPLSRAAKVAFFFFGFFVFWSIAVAIVLSTRGYRRKSKDAVKWMAIGTAFWIALFAVLDFTGLF